MRNMDDIQDFYEAITNDGFERARSGRYARAVAKLERDRTVGGGPDTVCLSRSLPRGLATGYESALASIPAFDVVVTLEHHESPYLACLMREGRMVGIEMATAPRYYGDVSHTTKRRLSAAGLGTWNGRLVGADEPDAWVRRHIGRRATLAWSGRMAKRAREFEPRALRDLARVRRWTLSPGFGFGRRDALLSDPRREEFCTALESVGMRPRTSEYYLDLPRRYRVGEHYERRAEDRLRSLGEGVALLDIIEGAELDPHDDMHRLASVAFVLGYWPSIHARLVADACPYNIRAALASIVRGGHAVGYGGQDADETIVRAVICVDDIDGSRFLATLVRLCDVWADVVPQPVTGGEWATGPLRSIREVVR